MDTEEARVILGDNLQYGDRLYQWSKLFQLYDTVGLVAGLAKSRE